MSTNPQVKPLDQIIYRKSDFTDDDSLTLFNQDLSNIRQLLNGLIGAQGPIRLGNHLDLSGNRITNVGDAIEPRDVVTQIVGQQRFGPEALAPAFNALGRQTLQTYRQLSNPNQREKYSSFLNAVLNTAPTSNTSSVAFGTPGGGTVSVTISAGLHQLVDGSIVPYSSRTDTLALPTSIAISTLTRSSNIVTAVTSAPDGLSVGEGVTVVGASDPTFDGTFEVLTVIPPDTFTYFQGGPNASATGGDISVGGVYYYTLTTGQNTLGLVTGSGSADTTSNRVAASNDGTTIIAVVLLNSGGGDILNSAAGATVQKSGSNVAIIRRL